MSFRRAIKRAAFGAAFAIVFPLILLAWLEKQTSRSEGLFAFGAQFLSLMPGSLGRFLRGAYYFGTLAACSWETHLGFGTMFIHRDATVGDKFSTGCYCVFGHIAAGEHIRIASHVSVPSGKRQHMDDDGRLDAGTRFETVAIGSRCWIGEGAIIMADVGENSIVSAGAVVLSASPPSVILGGNPAKVIRSVTSAELEDDK